MKRVLMIAYHFPPLAGSSGIQRTLRFVQHLPSFGWQPLVLTCSTNAYERIDSEPLVDVPPELVVERAFAVDAARHLSIAGRYPAPLARPDRWAAWRFDAVRRGLRMIEQYKPDALWTTYPIATAHAIGCALEGRSGIPWIADFRDPMAQDSYPEDLRTRANYRDIEERTIRQAAISTFTTPSAVRTYRHRYPGNAESIVLLENGYDEDAFQQALATLRERRPLQSGVVTLLHSGIVYPSERDPTQLFAAIRQLDNAGHIRPGRIRVRFRAPVHNTMLHSLAERFDVNAYVEICPPIGYRDALSEMLRADALLVLQAANCNEQVPAKVYEYLRARRPILGLADPGGDTSAILSEAGITAQAPLDSCEGIAALLHRCLADLEAGNITAESGYLPGPDAVASASRMHRTRDLAELLQRASIRRSIEHK